VAADFFTVEVWTRRLQRFLVLFFIDLLTLLAHVPTVLWMAQIGRK